MSVNIGDVVTWRQGLSRPNRKGLPIGIANCQVLEIGETDDGQPAARIKLPTQYLGSGWPETAGALIADLEPCVN